MPIKVHTPWQVRRYLLGNGHEILDANGLTIANTNGWSVITVPQMELICAAVNNNARLVGALKEISKGEWFDSEGQMCKTIADTALQDCGG